MTRQALEVTFMNGPADGRRQRLEDATATIGSNPENDLVIDFDPKVASTHLLIKYQDRQWRLVDHSDGLGVFVDGERLAGSGEFVPGSMLRLGDTLLRVVTSDAGG